MDDPADDAPPLVAAPRHLRRRTFHEEIPDTLLVPDVQPATAASHPMKRVAKASDSKESDFRRKRMVAMILVIVVLLSIPALVIALLLAG